jgi:signal transduction histidine kinase/CheY-like chemotaxis protein
MAAVVGAIVALTGVAGYQFLSTRLTEETKQALASFVQQGAEVESQWTTFLDQKLQRLRLEYLQRYTSLRGTDPQNRFSELFRKNVDSSYHLRSEFYSGAPNPWGGRLTGYSGGIDRSPVMTADHRLRRTLEMEMLFVHGSSVVLPAESGQEALTPFVDLYFFGPEKDLTIYWPGTPWYPDYPGGFDLAAQGDFSKTVNTKLPWKDRDRLWTGLYRDEVPKVWMVSFTMPIDLDGRNISAVGADISLASLNERLSSRAFRGASGLIVRPDGQVIASPALDRELVASDGRLNLAQLDNSPLKAAYAAIASQPGQSVVESVPGDLVAVARISGPDWLFVTVLPRAQVAGLADTVVLLLLGLGALTLLIETLLLWRILRSKVVNPLVSFTKATGDIAEGNLNPLSLGALPVQRRDEIGSLARSFLQMSRYLTETDRARREAEASLREQHEHLEEAVRERTRDLALARDAADAANLAKSVFLANMSHEIRTPMNAVLGFAQLLQTDTSLSDEARHQVLTIARSGTHLLAIINDILEMSRIESGRVEVHLEPLDLNALLRDLAALFAVQADSKGLSFAYHRSSELPAVVLSDVSKVRQVLINLLGNSVKFTKQGSVVMHASSPEPGLIRMEFEDTGIGIGPEEQERLFHPFERTRSGEQTAGGTGLGLSISREYARLLGGEITVSSQPGVGSRFVFEFRAEATQAAPEESSRSQPPRLAPGQGEVGALVVDDRSENRELLRAVLEPAGFRVVEADNGEAALDLAARWSPRVIFMDLVMGQLDGKETTRRLRQQPSEVTPVIIGFSASAFANDQADFLAAGLDGILTKPVLLRDVYTVLTNLPALRWESTSREVLKESAPLPQHVAMGAAWRAEYLEAVRLGNVSRFRVLEREARSADPDVAAWMAASLAAYDLETLGRLVAVFPAD